RVITGKIAIGTKELLRIVCQSNETETLTDYINM
ncbi:IS200/IS605 family transposase, partial [bacterium 1XD42-8]